MTDTARLQGKSVWVMAKGYLPDEGGMQTYSRAVAEAYAALGASVTVFTRTSAGPRDTRIGPVRVVDVGPKRGLPMHLRIARALRAERRQHGTPLLVHGTTWKTSIVPMALGLPFVTTFHGREMFRAKGWKLKLLSRIAHRAQRVVTVSHYTAEMLGQRIPQLQRPPVVAWNGVTDGLVRGAGKRRWIRRWCSRCAAWSHARTCAPPSKRRPRVDAKGSISAMCWPGEATSWKRCGLSWRAMRSRCGGARGFHRAGPCGAAVP